MDEGVAAFAATLFLHFKLIYRKLVYDFAAVLFSDNAPDNLKDFEAMHSNIKVISLHSYTTTLLHPVDQGII